MPLIMFVSSSFNTYVNLPKQNVALKCPNKKAKVLKAHGEVVTNKEVSDEEEMSPFEDANDDYVKYLVDVNLLNTRSTK
jgi:hypothetical protein